MSNGTIAVNTMTALAAVDDPADVAASLVGTIYELAMRLGVTPRTIADNAFTSLIDDDAWKVMQPALRDVLGRE